MIKLAKQKFTKTTKDPLSFKYQSFKFIFLLAYRLQNQVNQAQKSY
jgi:hypothetical protein